MPSPSVPVPGVGQVGEGLRNTWGLEEEEEEEDGGESSGGDSVEEVTKMDVQQHQENKSRTGLLIIVQKS